jgi:hypothetical protein
MIYDAAVELMEATVLGALLGTLLAPIVLFGILAAFLGPREACGIMKRSWANFLREWRK